jgi:hypothetical protein
MARLVLIFPKGNLYMGGIILLFGDALLILCYRPLPIPYRAGDPTIGQRILAIDWIGWLLWTCWILPLSRSRPLMTLWADRMSQCLRW